MTNLIFEDIELQSGYEEARNEFSDSISASKSGFEQENCDRLFRSIHELRQISKVLARDNLYESLTRIQKIVDDLKDRKIKWSEALIQKLADITSKLDQWFSEGISSSNLYLLDELEAQVVLRSYIGKNEPKDSYFQPRVSELLLQNGIISQDQFDKAQKLSQRTILEILIDEGYVSQETVDQFRTKLP